MCVSLVRCTDRSDGAFLWSCEQWTAAIATDVFLQLACGMKHLHACGVLHRDLKTDNALIQSIAPLVVKWADFGVSVKLDGKGVASTYGGDGAGNFFFVSGSHFLAGIARPFCLPATPALQCACACACVCMCAYYQWPVGQRIVHTRI
jgi:serine/threonine protein kinase